MWRTGTMHIYWYEAHQKKSGGHKAHIHHDNIIISAVYHHIHVLFARIVRDMIFFVPSLEYYVISWGAGTPSTTTATYRPLFNVYWHWQRLLWRWANVHKWGNGGSKIYYLTRYNWGRFVSMVVVGEVTFTSTMRVDGDGEDIVLAVVNKTMINSRIQATLPDTGRWVNIWKVHLIMTQCGV